MKKIISLTVTALVLSLIVSCISAPVRVVERKNDKTAFVYGYINLQGGKNSKDMNWMSILQFEPPTEKPYWSAAIKDGVFFNQNLLPGQYCISSFGSDNRTYKISYEVGCFEIKKADLFYFGAYELVWKNGKPRTLKKTHTPSEGDLIEKLLESTDPGTYWEAKLKKRLIILREAEVRKGDIPRAPSL